MPILKMDAWIIDKVAQPISEHVQVKTGHTCYYIAWWFAGLSLLGDFLFVNYIIQNYIAIPDANLLHASWLWLSIGLYQIVIGGVILDLYKTQRLSQKTAWSHRRQRHERMPFPSFWRFLMLATSALGLALGVFTPLPFVDAISLFSGSLFCAISGYFSACRPLPPNSKRNQEREDVSQLKPSPSVNRTAA